MNQNDSILRLAFKYGNSKKNSSGPYRDFFKSVFYRDRSLIFENQGRENVYWVSQQLQFYHTQVYVGRVFIIHIEKSGQKWERAKPSGSKGNAAM